LLSALALKAEMNSLLLLLILARMALGSVIIFCYFGGFWAALACLGGLGFIPIDYRKSRSTRLRFKLLAGSSLWALKAESQSKFSSGCTAVCPAAYWKGDNWSVFELEAMNFWTICVLKE